MPDSSSPSSPPAPYRIDEIDVDAERDENGEISGPPVRSSRQVVPDELRDKKLWVLWDLEQKNPLALWQTGHCYRADWNGGLEPDVRPETTYDEARMYATIPTRELHRTHSFPTTDEDGEPIDDPIPESVGPTILLPPDGQGTERTGRLMYIDFDDVRDPETERVTPEVASLIDRLESYTEVSRSGTGLHVLVYAELPISGWVDGDPLDDRGSVELYDRGRFFGGTWNHADGTPITIADQQDLVNELVAYYSPHRLEKDQRRDSTADGGPAAGLTGTDASEETNKGAAVGAGAGTDSASSTPNAGDRSNYYDVPLERFAEPSPIERTYTGGKQGAHPEHGKTTSGEVSLNYDLDTSDNRWHCFADNSGGGTMEMAAIMAGALECDAAGKGALAALTDEAFLRTCLYARDELNGFTTDMDPPYRALVTVAQQYGLSMADEDREILGRTSHKLARVIYDELSINDLE